MGHLEFLERGESEKWQGGGEGGDNPPYQLWCQSLFINKVAGQGRQRYLKRDPGAGVS